MIAPEQLVCPIETDDLIISGAAIQRIIASEFSYVTTVDVVVIVTFAANSGSRSCAAVATEQRICVVSAFNQIAAPIPHQDIPAVAADQMIAIIAAKEAVPPFAANNRVFASFAKMMKV